MGRYVAENCVKQLIQLSKPVKGARVAVLGFTFKENCPDTRNSKVFDIVKELREYGIEPVIADPQADVDEAERLYGIKMSSVSEVKDMDAVILAVAHKEFAGLSVADVDKYFKDDKKLLLDIKGVFNKKEYEEAGYRYWRL